MAPSKIKPKTKTKSAAKVATRRSKTPEKKVEPAQLPKKPAFAVGDRVTHKMFGTGKVLGLRDDKLSIQFAKNVTKEILSDFVSSA